MSGALYLFELSFRLILNPFPDSQAVDSSLDLPIKWVWSFRPTENCHTSSQQDTQYVDLQAVYAGARLSCNQNKWLPLSLQVHFHLFNLLPCSWKQTFLILIGLFGQRLSKVLIWPVLSSRIQPLESLKPNHQSKSVQLWETWSTYLSGYIWRPWEQPLSVRHYRTTWRGARISGMHTTAANHKHVTSMYLLNYVSFNYNLMIHDLVFISFLNSSGVKQLKLKIWVNLIKNHTEAKNSYVFQTTDWDVQHYFNRSITSVAEGTLPLKAITKESCKSRL